MSDDTDSPLEVDVKDFKFQQMKKLKVFDPAEGMPKERSSLLTISNKFGLVFVGLDRMFKVYQTRDLLAADKDVYGSSNEIVKDIPALAEVTVEMTLHHLALSCDDLTLSVCGMSEQAGLSLLFYDVRTFMNKARTQKLPFASLQPAVSSATLVQDLKWSPAQASVLAVCLSDGSMKIFDVTDGVILQGELSALHGITCICWSPKGKQVAAGKRNGTVCQYTPALEEKKVIPCPPFFTDPVKALDVLWLKTLVFVVTYAAAADDSECPPELVSISLPKKDEKVEPRYVNFGECVYGSTTEQQHHYFLSYIEDWDLVFVASAAATEVNVISRRDDKMWELWNLEDSSRAELPVNDPGDDTFPLGMAIDYTNQEPVHIKADEKTLPPVPVMLMLSTEGLLCPFALLNLNPGIKPLVSPPTALPLQAERLPKPGSVVTQPTKTAAAVPSAPMAFPSLSFTSAATSGFPVPAASSSTAPFSVAPTAPVSSSGFTFSIPTTHSTSAPSAPVVSSAFSFGASSTLGTGPSVFSFASKPPSDTPSAPSAFSFSNLSFKPSTPAQSVTPQSVAIASPSTAKVNLNERLSTVETPASSFSFTSSLPKPNVSTSSSFTLSPFSSTKPPAVLAPVRPVQTSTLPAVVQKPSPAAPVRVQPPQAAVGVKALEKQLQQKKDSDPIMAGILEEIAHFQKELDDLKARSAKADFKVGTNEEMKDLRKESEDLHIFTLEIKETTESLHGDVGTLKTSLLEGFAGAEEAKTQSELSKDRNYRQLLYKRPLDPRSEEQLKEIRRLYQYVTFAMEDVNDVLDVEWEKHLEKKKKHKHMAVPGREGLFTTLSNNLYIINQQKNKLDQLVNELTSLRLYSKSTPPTIHQPAASPTTAGLESELESLRDSLVKTSLGTSPDKIKSKSQAVKISPGKQSQLRNFLSKGQMPPVRSTAPANLSRSAFLSPKYYEDLDDASSTSSLSQSLEPHPPHLEQEEEELQPLPLPMTSINPALSTPRHPTVMRTPSIQPGFGGIQSTPLAKMCPVPGMGIGLSPIPSPIPSNKINLSGADSTALATKTVKHGAPPAERSVPVTIPAQQAAANAALRRQMASQKPALVGTSLTESTLKTVPQVVNVQELKDKGPVSSILSSPAPDSAAQAFTTVSSNQARRNQVQSVAKVSTETASIPQTGFVFGQSSKMDVSVAAHAGSGDQSTSKGFPFTPMSTSFSFTPATQGKDLNKFSFGNGKMFGQSEDEPFSLTPKSHSPSLGTGSPTLATSSEAAKPTNSTPAIRTELQSQKPVGGETLGIFSGLRVGQGEEARDPPTKPTPGFTFGDTGLGIGKGLAPFSFAAALQKPAEDSTAPDLSKGATSGSLFKPPECSTKPAFFVPQSDLALPTSFSSLLVASSESSEEPKAPQQPPEPTSPPAREPATTEPAVETTSRPAAPEPEAAVATSESAAPTQTPTSLSSALTLASVTPTQETPSTVTAPAETTPAASAGAPSTTDPTASVPPPASTAATAASVSQVAPAAFQTPTSDKPGSIFTQPAPACTDSSTILATPVISTAAAPVTTTATTTVVSSATITTANTNNVFGQPAAATPTSSAPSSTGFSSVGFVTSAGTAFGKSVFGQVSGFGPPASSTGTSSGFTFGQSTFGASSSSANTGAGSLFGGATASNASSFSFGTSSASTVSSTGSGLFGQSTAPVFGQSSAFGQGSLFGSNTTTSSSTGFSFGQSSGFSCSAAAPVFGQQSSGGSLFGQQPSSGGSLFGSSLTNTAGSSGGGGFFSGLGGKPSEDAANKNPFGTTASTGGFSQSPQTGANNLFGNSSTKTFSFGQPSFGDQIPSGTFTTGGGSVASQGFGSFSTPAKTGGFGSAPVFGSPPSFGGSPSFGGAASFGSGPSFSSPVGSTAGKVFGEGTAAANMGGFGFASPPSAPSFSALATQNTPSFESLAHQGTGFGSQPSSFSGFGQQPQSGGFSGSTFGSANQSSSQTFSSWRS
ncbi:nuclear pore complex protein Nup214 isoform 2-T2 [Pholidichthys leucotaenia]